MQQSGLYGVFAVAFCIAAAVLALSSNATVIVSLVVTVGLLAVVVLVGHAKH
jgi:hypothetical protein